MTFLQPRNGSVDTIIGQPMCISSIFERYCRPQILLCFVAICFYWLTGGLNAIVGHIAHMLNRTGAFQFILYGMNDIFLCGIPLQIVNIIILLIPILVIHLRFLERIRDEVHPYKPVYFKNFLSPIFSKTYNNIPCTGHSLLHNRTRIMGDNTSIATYGVQALIAGDWFNCFHNARLRNISIKLPYGLTHFLK